MIAFAPMYASYTGNSFLYRGFIVTMGFMATSLYCESTLDRMASLLSLTLA